MADSNASSLESISDLGTSPQGIARRWKLELKLADKREVTWRKKVSDIYRQYTPESPQANSFNVLYPNTETMRQAVYNSLPQPDARRRYQDEDPLGKAVAQVLTRSLEYCIDTYDFDGLMKADVLCMLLAGRSISRIRYVPSISQVGGEDSPTDDDTQESEAYEEIDWEQAVAERVQWDDFRILSAAKSWDEVTAIAFRHRFTRADCKEKFGDEMGNAIPLDSADDEDVKNSKVDELFKTAEVWEIWNKDDKEVIWLCPTYQVPCKVQDDPLSLSGFFPIPRPLYAIENDSSLVPACLFTQYEQQAKELNKVCKRINNLYDALKVRGVYDATLTELDSLMKAGDNELIAAENVTALLERGGLDKAIWMMPIEQAAVVIKELERQRDATKQIIYEITGISDIMRSASDANETFGAQKIKTQWGTQRLQRMQKEVQRYIRDLIRIKAEIIAEKFQPETLEKMTLVQLPHQAEVDQQKQMMMMQYQQASMQAQQQGQQPPPQPPAQPDPITWEAVVTAMRDDATRSYRVDIETDSTLSASQDSDMEALQRGIGALGQVGQVFGPAVAAGEMPVEALKALMLAITRKMKMGSAVEDALEKIQQPQPKGDPEAGKVQAQMQIEQGKAQSVMQVEQMKAQLQDQQHQRQLASNQQFEQMKSDMQMQLQAHEQEVQAQQNQHQNQLEAEREIQKAQLTAQLEDSKRANDNYIANQKLEFERWKIEYETNAKFVIAEMNVKNAGDIADTGTSSSGLATLVEAMNVNLQDLVTNQNNNHTDLVSVMTRPKTIVRDINGKAQGIA